MRICCTPLLFSRLLLLACSSCYLPLAARAEDPVDTEEQVEVLAGHSFHGEAFNEGPRQAAYLMDGMADIHFPSSTKQELAQQFINQGVSQLHGFWYYEAERSFRQAAVHDPDCAIAYWGMAMANVENRKRGRSFIEEATERKDNATRREQMYIDALAEAYRDEDVKGKKIERKTRAQKYTQALENIVLEFPDDLEAQAFLALQLWQNDRSDLPIPSNVAVNAVLQDVFDQNPMHPAHHYRIHLWDRPKPAMALHSAALCGQSSPGIAHMWHMPGHIYSKLHRYQDAAWQQEASARVDHAHMMRDRVMPDQIHNFAHNNEWLIRNLLKVGRVDDALALAKNMLELPRHPKYNTLKRGSTKYGRERLWLTLTTYRLWPELIALCDTMYLEPTDDPELQLERQQWLAVAQALTGDAAAAAASRQTLAEQLAQNESSLAKLKQEQTQDEAAAAAAETPPTTEAQASAAPDAAEVTQADEPQAPAADVVQVADAAASPAPEATADTTVAEADVDAQKAEANRKRRTEQRKAEQKKLNDANGRLKKAIAAIQAAEHAAAEQWVEAVEQLDKSGWRDPLLKAEWLASTDRVDEALKLVNQEISSKPGEVLPVATKAWIRYRTAGSEAARTTFEELRLLACMADLETPLLERLLPLAAEVGAEPHWAAEHQLADDIGQRPELESLGPFRWQPYLAPEFVVENESGESFNSAQLRGQPTLVIFYLGFGCLHCVEQLHEFSPRAEQFRSSGIEVMAISSEDRDSLKKALSAYTKPLDIPLYTDQELATFKAYRCFDDFEQQPLHGTFLLDPDGRVLWQDISYEPFMDVDFALAESHRLLKLAGHGELLSEPIPTKTVASVD